MDHDLPGTLDRLERIYRLVSSAVTEDTADCPSGASAWTVRELLFHLVMDARRGLVTAASPADEDPDVDRVTYWRDFRPDPSRPESDHVRFVRRAAGAYDGVGDLLEEWSQTSTAAVTALRRTTGRVSTQGHVLDVADFAHTLLVEAVVHHVDLTAHAEDVGTPPDLLAAVRPVLVGLLGAPLPVAWDDRAAVLKGTGRAPLDARDRAALGASAVRFPLFG